MGLRCQSHRQSHVMITLDLEEMTTEELSALVMADLEPLEADRNCGRVVCAWCKPNRDMGPAHGLKRGQITHGICPKCSAAMLADES